MRVESGSDQEVVLPDGSVVEAEVLGLYGAPPSDWDRRFRAIVAEVRLEKAREWQASPDLTTQMTNDAIGRVLERTRESR